MPDALLTPLVPEVDTSATPAGRKRRVLAGYRISFAIVVGAVLLAIFGPYIAPHDPNAQNLLVRLQPPSSAHWLGTDDLGRDVFSRVLVAARIDVGVGILGALLPFVLGTVIGGLAAYFGSVWDLMLMRLGDLVLAFPVYVLVIALVAVEGSSVKTLLFVFTVVGWVPYARVVRAAVLQVKGFDYITAARLGGLSNARVIVRHLLPNVIFNSVTVLITNVMVVLLTLASFSYLGLGIQPPTAEWGAMIAEAQPYMQQQWWLVAAPGVMIAVIGFGFLSLGERFNERRH